MADLKLTNVEKAYGEVKVLKNINLDIKQGELIVFVGPSGCGKSTLLRMIAGLEDVTEGDIEIAGRVVNDLPPVQRGIAMVFQSYALYPHMSVYENIAFPLRVAKNCRRPKSTSASALPQRCSSSKAVCSTVPASFPADSASALPSAAPSCASPRFSFSTSRYPTSTRRSARKCASN
jgi:ABC-type sugar transport system ATPase subunit